MSEAVRRYRRSPFCLLYWDGPQLVAENCDAQRRFRIAERYVGLLHRLSEPVTVSELAEALALAPTTVEYAVQRLVDMSLVVADGTESDDHRADVVDQPRWDLVDLAMQRRTARGGFDPAAPRPGRPPPAFKPVPTTPAVELCREGLDERWTLKAALEQRRSIRTYAARDVALDDLGRFLYSTASVTGTGCDAVVGEFSYRPFPSAGGRHPLEIYAACNAVAGLKRGAYYYDPGQHRLHLVRPADSTQAEITRHARVATGDVTTQDPAVVLMITAVFARTMWKYENIAMGLILKDVGALYQTMYLVATALGLAPCALGGWMERDNARWLGLDPLVESQVGCFLLGYPRSRRAMRDSWRRERKS